MDGIFLVLCVVPLVAAGLQLVVSPGTYSWKEAALQGVLCTVLVVIVWNTGRYAEASDTEIWNGVVSAKEAIRKDCPRGWVRTRDSHCTHYTSRSRDTNCRTVEGKRKCDSVTEYRYRYDWERRYFVAASDIGLRLEYQRVDQQGVNVPPVYQGIQIGDPAAKTSSYQNWVRGASVSLFHEDGAVEEKYRDLIPAYPIELYDGIFVDRVLAVGVNIDTAAWSRDLSRSLGVLGPQRQMNAVVILVDASKAAEDYAFAVRRAWQGFKKNDAVIFVGTGADLAVRWAKVLSWSSASAFDIGLQNSILDLRGTQLTSELLNRALMDHGSEYQRRSMQEFEYLKDSIPVPAWLYLIVAILSIGGTAGLSFFFHRTEYV